MPFKRLMSNFIQMAAFQQENPILHGLAMADLVLCRQGQHIALEFKPDSVTMREIYYLARDLCGRSESISTFILITPTTPTAQRVQDFRHLCETVLRSGPDDVMGLSPLISKDKMGDNRLNLDLHWFGLNDFLEWLGFSEPFNPFDQITQTKLQIGAIAMPILQAQELLRHGEAPTASFYRQDLADWSFEDAVQQSRAFMSGRKGSLLGICRHISSFDVAKILESQGKEGEGLEACFGVGTEQQNIFVVLSDFKNSSALAKATRPEVLNVVMYEYYQKVRDLTWRFGGYLDKFMGDGVAVLFNYPVQRKDTAMRTLMYAKCLVALGRALLDVIQDEINEDIETGTRVGIGNGALRVLDIGYTEMEPSFVGDVYNYAARLESQSPVDGVLLDHRSRTRLMEYGVDILQQLELKDRLIQPHNAKGQTHATKCWEITPDHLQKLPFTLLESARQTLGETTLHGFSALAQDMALRPLNPSTTAMALGLDLDALDTKMPESNATEAGG